MRKCKKCLLEKELKEFYVRKRGNYINSQCKLCVNKRVKSYNIKNKIKISEYSKNYLSNEKVNGYAIYYLPEEHYIGFTGNLKARIRSHKSKGRITQGFEIVGVYNCPIFAHLQETRLHLMGYNGFQHKY